MKPVALVSLFLLALVLPGCGGNHYVVEITPDGEQFERKLICWHQSGQDPPEGSSLPDKELDRIGQLYDTREAIEDNKILFTGKFRGQTPGDLGGAGSYRHFPTPLGTLAVYVERFRGDDDLGARLDEQRAAADQLIDLVAGWLESELGDDPRFDRLRAFLHHDLRDDLRNLGLYAWTAEAIADYQDDVGQEFMIRVAQYLAERDYLSLQEVPYFARAFLEEDPARLAAVVRRLVARRMGIQGGQPIPESLAFLGDPQRLKDSLDRYIRTTELYKKRAAEWKREQNGGPDAEPLDPMELVSELAMAGLLSFSFGASDSLEVTLHTGVQPTETNGQWDAESRSIVWSRTITDRAALPCVCFAVWNRPDEATQERHFGRVLLRGESLTQYIMWYHGLTDAEARQWDAFLAECRPGEGLPHALESFRFTADPQPPQETGEQPEGLAKTATDLILAALEDDAQE